MTLLSFDTKGDAMEAVVPENSLGSMFMTFRSEGGGEQEVCHH